MIDKQKSLELAQRIEMIKLVIMGIDSPERMAMAKVGLGNLIAMEPFDIEYSEEAAKKFRDQASWQESAAVLNPSHSQGKNDLLRAQAQTLEHFNKFVRGLMKCEELKGSIKTEQETRDKISSLFV